MAALLRLSKAAVVALVKTVALENKNAGIAANTVLPGAMDTPGSAGATGPETHPTVWRPWRTENQGLTKD